MLYLHAACILNTASLKEIGEEVFNFRLRYIYLL